MRIIIDTDGYGYNTIISINGKKLMYVKEFNFSVRASKSAKVQLIQELHKDNQPIKDERGNVIKTFNSWYGGDFSKIDECSEWRNGG